MPFNTKELDIQKSSNNGRMVSIIGEQASLANELLKKKTKAEMTSEELKNLGITFNEKSDYMQAQEFLNASLVKVEQENLTEELKNLRVAECYYGLANCERELGRPQAAIALFTKAREFAEKTSNTDIQYNIGRNIGIAYLIVEDFRNAADSFCKAKNVAEQANQPGRIPAVKSYFGLALVLSGEAKKGFQELNGARNLYPKNGREESMDWAAHRFHMARAYEAAKDPVNALNEYAESRRLRIQMIDSSKIGSVYYHSRVGDATAGLGRVCLSLGCNTEAQKYLAEALESYEALGATKKVEEIKKSLLSLASTQTPANMFYVGSKPTDVTTDRSQRLGMGSKG